MCLRKLLIVLLLLSCSFCWSEVSFRRVDWNAIENNVNNIEFNLKQLQTENETLKTQFNEQVLFSANQSIQLQNSENKLKQSEKATKRWKISFTAVSVVALVEAVTIIIIATK